MQNITLKVNGIQRQVNASPDMVLIDLLREDLHLTGTKQSCDRKGQCGACTVIVNGKAVRSCITKVVNLEGAEVISIEGLGTTSESSFDSGSLCTGWCDPMRLLYSRDDNGQQSFIGPESEPGCSGNQESIGAEYVPLYRL